MSQSFPAETRARPADAAPATNRRARFAWLPDFTELFRAFRVAIHPANIIAVVAALIMLYAAGWAFDAAWGRQVAPQEITQYQVDKPKPYAKYSGAWLDERPRRLRGMLEDAQINATPAQITALSHQPDAAYERLRRHDEREFNTKLTALAVRTNREVAHKILPLPLALRQERQQDRRAAARLAHRLALAQAAAGRPIFAAFVAYERAQFHNLVANTLGIVRLGNVGPAGRRDGAAPPQVVPAALTLGLFPHHPRRVTATPTIAGNFINMFYTGPAWLVTAAAPMRSRTGDTGSRMFFRRLGYIASLLLLAVLFLALVAIVGGAICRHAACQVAGVETSFLDCLNMARRGWLSLVQAWLTPFAALLVLGLVMALLALVGAIPVVGQILVALFLFLFLAAGFVLMLIVLGILGGFHLLFPAIAAEGADSFDAVSRAFSFLFARPWRMLWYVILAIVYGVATYLIVAFALFVLLVCTHIVIGWGMGVFGAAGATQLGVSRLSTIWPMPHFGRFISPVNWAALSWPQAIAALLVRWWVYLITMSLAAYVISYYFSSSTIMYLLLRRLVDGQDFSELAPDDAFLPPRRTSTAESPGAVAGDGTTSPVAPAATAPPRPAPEAGGFTEITVHAPPSTAEKLSPFRPGDIANAGSDVVIVTPDTPNAPASAAESSPMPTLEPPPPEGPEGPPQ